MSLESGHASSRLPQGTVPLPLIGGLQCYGLEMFHASDDKHVIVVQTGTALVSGGSPQYYALLR